MNKRALAGEDNSSDKDVTEAERTEYFRELIDTLRKTYGEASLPAIDGELTGESLSLYLFFTRGLCEGGNIPVF